MRIIITLMAGDACDVRVSLHQLYEAAVQSATLMRQGDSGDVFYNKKFL
jgi:hypothetical protein